MPTFQSTAKTKANVVTVAAVQNLITQNDLTTLQSNLSKLAEVEALYDQISKAVKNDTKALFQKVLGVKKEDEVKAMPPETVAKLMESRFNSKLYNVEEGELDILLAFTGSKDTCSYKDALVAAIGEAEVEKLPKKTSYSYKLGVAPKG